jgi:CreA protein
MTSPNFLFLACVCVFSVAPADAFSVPPSPAGLATSHATTRSMSPTGDNNSNRHVSPPSGWQVPKFVTQWMGAATLGTSLAISALASSPFPALAESPRIVGQLQGSGLVFKDTLQIESFDDPKVQGVTLYISNFQRPITERLTSNFLQDPSYASVVR